MGPPPPHECVRKSLKIQTSRETDGSETVAVANDQIAICTWAAAAAAVAEEKEKNTRPVGNTRVRAAVCTTNERSRTTRCVVIVVVVVENVRSDVISVIYTRLITCCRVNVFIYNRRAFDRLSRPTRRGFEEKMLDFRATGFDAITL